MADKEEKSLIDRLREGKGTAVRRAREERGLSQTELAKLANTSQQTVDRIERGAVEHSRAYPRILDVLGIPNEGFNLERFKKTVERMKADSAESYRRFMEEGKHASDIVTKGRMPVYAPGDGTGPRLINAIPKAYPVEFSEDAYGLVMFGTEMEPAIRNGEIAIVNPNLPPLWQSEVVVTIDGKPTIRTFIGESDTVWSVQQWKPLIKTDLKKDEYAMPQLVVAKIGRSI
ncbi:hypothetical protein C7U61_14730 [Rhizobium sp. JAB6]|uniref:XRE family transcriptional regulator n=1 Tax=Rhizobium sp. JAB6 TaxID=2127050 RepID=UPI000D135A60|nr:XRE family transcriptional regulator [Rhizobium sp. JAB6]PST19742.1 hypothetical protein C7U61_14730 [Rhizobium sp. JAB6]